MADKETDALSAFDFNKVGGGGNIWLKFEAGRPLTLRVLTVDPIVSQSEFVDKQTGEVDINTRFAFVVYNFTDNVAQILQASPGVAKRIGQLHKDPDFGADIRKIDIKISPTGEMKERRYDIQVLPKARDLTAGQIKEAAAIGLADKVKGYRMSQWDEMQKANKAADPLDEINAGKHDDILGGSEELPDLDNIPF